MQNNSVAKLETDSESKRRDRGIFFKSISRKVCLPEWMDCKSVVLTSKKVGSDQVQVLRKFKAKKYVDASQLRVIRMCNHCLGEAYKTDRTVSYYRIFINKMDFAPYLL